MALVEERGTKMASRVSIKEAAELLGSNAEGKIKRKQITLRIPGAVYEALKKEAETIGISVNELILLKINPLQVDFEDHGT
jgi:predicted HicB family RNase H-like nuclease|nr:MAG TPA: hypothetical protein [Caudoviricetes sp.]